MNKQTVTNILLVVVVLLLLGIFFQGKIRSYFKAQEVLKRANVFNIPDVALQCYKYITDEASSENGYSPACQQEIDSYNVEAQRWTRLVNEYRDINCKDFTNKKEASEFNDWIGGELASGFYADRNIVKGTKPDATSFAFQQNSMFDGHCRYDPYGLDTNNDCNACESY